jgi:hypothetical protein
VLRAIERFQLDFSTFKVDFALDGPIPWLYPDAGRAGTIHIAEGIDARTRAMSSIALREIPAEPFHVAGQYARATRRACRRARKSSGHTRTYRAASSTTRR